jgi:formamidopyrimidine-DNA glycosylase
MPELPEVETVVRSLRPRLVGAQLGRLFWSGLGLRLGRAPDIAALTKLVKRGQVTAVRRKAKYILIDVGDQAGKRRGSVIVHLGMSGRLQVAPADRARLPHTHVVIDLDGARELRFVDPRRFGWVGAAANPDDLPELADLGPDPLSELDAEMLAAALASSRAPIKAFLLDQRKIAGLGNIYVCEALLRAGIHPSTPADRCQKHAAELVAQIRVVLELGIANRGTTLRDYVDGDGIGGGNTSALLAYGREGLSCNVCNKGIITRQVDAGRSTFFCPRCQPRPRRPRQAR